MKTYSKEIFFGTANVHKLKEIESILGEEWQLKSFRDLEKIPAVEETENTLEGNAKLKARSYFDLTSIPCFADDTGLEVAALQGRPGVFSSRYAGEDGNAIRNMEKLLEELKGEKNRLAQFRTVIAFYDGKTFREFDGIMKGRISETPSGKEGFGYDPVFIADGYSCTVAELSPEEKNRISHRAKAIEKLVDFLRNSEK